VAVPLHWKELKGLKDPAQFTIKDVELSRKRQFEKFWTGLGGCGQRLVPIVPSPLFTGLAATLQNLPLARHAGIGEGAAQSQLFGKFSGLLYFLRTLFAVARPVMVHLYVAAIVYARPLRDARAPGRCV
jgi:hypothetical protein